MPSLLLHRAAALALLGLIGGAVHSVFVTIKLAPDAPLPPNSQPNTQPNIQPAALGLEISLADSRRLFDAGVPFVDARHLDEYVAGHVESAFWMPAEEFLSGKVPEPLKYLDPASPVVVYCGGGMCDASRNVVVLLQQAGFTRCHIFHDGFPAWAAAGNPVAAGTPEIGGPR